MSEHIRLSLWFASQSAEQVLPRLQGSVECLPREAIERGVQQLATTAVDWSEPALVEERFEPGLALAEAIEQMREFVQDDCACEVEMAWLLWVYGEKGWEQRPQPLRLISRGPEFGDAAAEEGHLVVEFGLDEPFLAELAPWNVDTRRRLQANILQLLAYTHKLEAQLQPAKRRLWSEEEGDWTQKLVRRLQMAEIEGGQRVQ